MIDQFKKIVDQADKTTSFKQLPSTTKHHEWWAVYSYDLDDLDQTGSCQEFKFTTEQAAINYHTFIRCQKAAAKLGFNSSEDAITEALAKRRKKNWASALTRLFWIKRRVTALKTANHNAELSTPTSRLPNHFPDKIFEGDTFCYPFMVAWNNFETLKEYKFKADPIKEFNNETLFREEQAARDFLKIKRLIIALNFYFVNPGHIDDALIVPWTLSQEQKNHYQLFYRIINQPAERKRLKLHIDDEY